MRVGKEISKHRLCNGSWFRDCVENDQYGQCIVVPNQIAIRHAETMSPNPAPAVSACRFTCDALQLSSCFLDLLPDELLIKILGSQVPSDRTFHFTPQTRTSDPMYTVSVHQLCRTKQSPKVNVLSLALVCRRFRNLAYDILYSSNRFILDVSPMEQPLSVRIGGCYFYHKQRSFSSWSKMYSSSISHRGNAPIFPLTATTLGYIKDLKVCVALTYIPEQQFCGLDSNAAKGAEVLRNLCTSLADNENRFKTLAVHLDIADHYGSQYISRQLSDATHRKRRHFERCIAQMDFSCVTFTPIALSHSQKQALRWMCDSLIQLADERKVRAEGLLQRRKGLEETVQYVPKPEWENTGYLCDFASIICKKVVLCREDMVFPRQAAGIEQSDLAL